MMYSVDRWLPQCVGVAVILMAVVTIFFKQQLKIVGLMLKLPGPYAYPVIGNAYLATDHKQLIHLGRHAHKEYGPLIRAWIALFPIVFVLEPSYIQKILSSSKHIEKMYFYRLMHTFLGEGLITCEGTKWKHHRKLIQPSFSLSVLEGYITSFSTGASLLLNKIDDIVHNKRTSAVDVTKLVNEVVVNILNESILGIPFNSKSIQKSPFRQGKIEVQHRWAHPWLMVNPIYKLTKLATHEMEQMKNLFEFTKKIIGERRRMEENDKNQCFLDFLLQICDSNDGFSEEDCIHEICTFMLAGQDSVGAALAFCLRLLAEHTDCQNKVVHEQDEIFGDSTRSPTSNDIKEMKYLEQCIKETLRLYPSVPIIARKLGDDVDLGDHVLPKGCDVLISPFATHRLPQHFPDPDKFDPARFETTKCESRHPYSYLPFSAGPRNCIGYKFSLIEMKIILSTVVRNYTLELVPGREEIDLRYRITLRSSGGVWVKFIPKSKTN